MSYQNTYVMPTDVSFTRATFLQIALLFLILLYSTYFNIIWVTVVNWCYLSNFKKN